jgi:hypothetical protein
LIEAASLISSSAIPIASEAPTQISPEGSSASPRDEQCSWSGLAPSTPNGLTIARRHGRVDRFSPLPYAHGVRGRGLRWWLFWLGALLAVVYLVLGIVIGVFDDETWSSNGERVFWLVLTLGGAALLAAGLWLTGRAASIAAVVLIVIGAAMGGVATFWTVITGIVAIAVIVLAFMWARQRTAAT